MTYCNNLHERTSPIEIFFFGHTLSRPRPTGRCPDLYAMLPKSISPMHSNQLRSILVSTPEKKVSFGLLSFTTRSNSFGESLCITCTSPPPIGKNSFLGCFALFQSSFSIHYHYSILSFFVLLLFSESQKRTLNHSCPPYHVGLCFMRACADGVLVWVQTVWINRLLTFFQTVLYYLLITGDSVYLVVVVVYSSFDTLTHHPLHRPRHPPRTPPPRYDNDTDAV